VIVMEKGLVRCSMQASMDKEEVMFTHYITNGKIELVRHQRGTTKRVKQSFYCVRVQTVSAIITLFLLFLS
jgi:hypothetical protein